MHLWTFSKALFLKTVVSKQTFPCSKLARERCEICSELTIKTPQNVTDFVLLYLLLTLNINISHLFLVFLLLTLHKYFFSGSHVFFWKKNHLQWRFFSEVAGPGRLFKCNVLEKLRFIFSKILTALWDMQSWK